MSTVFKFLISRKHILFMLAHLLGTEQTKPEIEIIFVE